MTLKNDFDSAVLRWLQTRVRDAVSIDSYDEETKNGGGCETCWYEYVVVEIWYRDTEGKTHSYETTLGFTEFLDQILEA